MSGGRWWRGRGSEDVVWSVGELRKTELRAGRRSRVEAVIAHVGIHSGSRVTERGLDEC